MLVRSWSAESHLGGFRITYPRWFAKHHERKGKEKQNPFVFQSFNLINILHFAYRKRTWWIPSCLYKKLLLVFLLPRALMHPCQCLWTILKLTCLGPCPLAKWAWKKENKERGKSTWPRWLDGNVGNLLRYKMVYFIDLWKYSRLLLTWNSH